MTRKELIENILNPQTDEDRVILNTYKQIYDAIGVDFVDLVKNGKMIKDFKGAAQIEIPFMDYEIDREVMESTIDFNAKSLPSLHRDGFRNTILLGCSPRFTELSKTGAD